MMSMSEARQRVGPPPKMRAAVVHQRVEQRSVISAAEIWRCTMPASSTHLRISAPTAGSGAATPLVVVLVPSPQQFSGHSDRGAKTGLRRTAGESRLFQVTIFFTDTPAEQSSRRGSPVARWSHRHAEIGKAPGPPLRCPHLLR